MTRAGEPPDAPEPPRRAALADRRRAEAARAQRRWRWLRKLLFGDWTPVLRDPLDLIRLSFAVASVGFLQLGGEAPAGRAHRRSADGRLSERFLSQAADARPVAPVPYFDGLRSGETHALVESFAGVGINL